MAVDRGDAFRDFADPAGKFTRRELPLAAQTRLLRVLDWAGQRGFDYVEAFAVGFLAVWLEGRGPQALYWRAFLIVGVLGALTTYSALMLECLLMARSQRSELLLGYLGGTLAAGLVLVWAGAKFAAMLRPAY